MANFSTHLSVAAAGSGMAASFLLASGGVSPSQSILLWLSGCAGGLLPDIDSDTSLPLKILFSILAVLGAVMFVLESNKSLPVIPLWVGMLLVFLAIRYGGMKAFAEFTVHRGLFHSLLAGAFFCVSMVWSCKAVFNTSSLFAWLMGLFILLGFLIHLLLDELYAVNFDGLELKQSFGTAFKVVSLKNIVGTLVMLGLTVFISFQVPNPKVVKSFIIKQQGMTYLFPLKGMPKRE